MNAAHLRENDGIFRPRPPSESCFLVVSKRLENRSQGWPMAFVGNQNETEIFFCRHLLNLSLGVHHEWPMLRHWLVNRSPLQHINK